MAYPNDPAYYSDCYDLFDRALASPGGVQKRCASEDEAREWQARMHKARALNRRLIVKAFPDDLRKQSSEYYKIVVRVAFDADRDLWLLKCIKRELKHEEVEELMPAEIVSEEYGIGPAMLALPELKEKNEQDLAQDEFDLESERNLDPSAPRPSRDRRF